MPVHTPCFHDQGRALQQTATTQQQTTALHHSMLLLQQPCPPSCPATIAAVPASLLRQRRPHNTSPQGSSCHPCPICWVGLTAAEAHDCILWLPAHAWQLPGYQHQQVLIGAFNIAIKDGPRNPHFNAVRKSGTCVVIHADQIKTGLVLGPTTWAVASNFHSHQAFKSSITPCGAKVHKSAAQLQTVSLGSFKTAHLQRNPS